MIIAELDKDKEMLMRTAGISTWNLNLHTGLREQIGGASIFPDNFTHDQFVASMHPNDVRLFEIVENSLRSGVLKESRNVFRIRKNHTDTKYSYFEVSLVAKDEGGVVNKIGCVFRDVTSQTLYKQTLEQGKIRTQLTMQESDLMQFDFDSETDILTLYQTEGFPDVPQSGPVGKFAEHVHPDDKPLLVDMVNRMRSHEDFKQTIYFRLKNKNGDQWYNLQMFVIALQRNPQGEVAVYTGLIRDNTRWIRLMQKQEGSKNNEDPICVHDVCEVPLSFDGYHGAVRFHTVSAIDNTIIAAIPADKLMNVLPNLKEDDNLVMVEIKLKDGYNPQTALK